MENYSRRTYRLKSMARGLEPFRVQVKESDLYILASRNLKETALESLKKVREEIENWIVSYPEFGNSLKPIDAPEGVAVPGIIKKMYRASKACGVGPMAAVAGAVSEFVGSKLLEKAPEVIVENGGDIFAYTKKQRTAMIFTGKTVFKEKIGVRLPVRKKVGLCTSSGKIGHSLSFGNADAVVVLSKIAPIADAAATAIGNKVRTSEHIEKAINMAKKLPVEGVLIFIDDSMGAWGNLEIERL